MRNVTRWLGSVLAVVAALVLVHPNVHAQAGAPIDSTHFWTYTIMNPVGGPFPVIVRDQFLPDTPIEVWRPVKLVNWVQKNNSPVRDTLNHFVWWDVQPKIPVGRIVEIDNQFGKYIIGVDQLDFMLVPAWKNEARPTHPELSHYLCYRAQGPGPNIPFSLHDEWRFDVRPVFELRYLCNPCQKIHQGQVFPPIDLNTHLAVYQLPVNSEQFYPPVFDQFGQMQYVVSQRTPEWLFVPSQKREVPTDSKRQSWGRIKTLYR